MRARTLLHRLMLLLGAEERATPGGRANGLGEIREAPGAAEGRSVPGLG